ncbi:S8 family peptidase [Microbacterium sp. Clip185]|uniref:S8 family peptidase n=1 Tax=Microbacterium sp. Clip185 TaxID=3025663 RepID=UPI002365AA85|nr:S8/S53 family peptidase [Microbacterium sp. Clip185]WDG19763.1 S8/S53 family peptidase [Microbacterium sp. Clip185]
MVVSRSRWVRAGAVVAVGLVGVLFGAVPASAADDGQWWYSAYGVADVHAEGWTGKGVKIAVVDTQINPDLPDFQGADLTVAEGSACVGKDPSTSVASAGAQHGSTVTAMLIGNGTGVAQTKGIVPDASVTFYGVGATADCDPLPEVAESKLTPIMWMVKRAVDDGADIVSVSMVTGEGTTPDDRVLAEAAAKKVPVVAGNPNDVFKEGGLPAGLNSVVGVSAVDSDQKLPIAALGVENVVTNTTVVAPGVNIATIGDGSDPGSWDVSGRATGTSLATPLVAGILAAAKQKYPDATGNQLIQSLTHNTGAEDHELQYSDTDGFGYGVASLGHVLSKDPTQYEDVNPLLNKDVGPTQEDIDEAAAALASPPATDQPSPDGIGAFLPVIVGVGVGVVVLFVAGVVVTVVLVRRSRRRVGS